MNIAPLFYNAGLFYDFESFYRVARYDTNNIESVRFDMKSRCSLCMTNAVDKVISYIENKNTGAWKNNLCFMADDGNNADSFTSGHMEEAGLGDRIG